MLDCELKILFIFHLPVLVHQLVGVVVAVVGVVVAVSEWHV